MAVGKGFFDQYSVFCVFGSVVGCVVVPLITQSVESVIFSAIVISLTATHLTKRATNHSDSFNKGNNALVERRNSRKSKDKDKESAVSNNPRKRKSISQSQLNGDSPQCRKKKEDELRRSELAKQLEWEKKQEEKRERKLKKKEERIRRKEQEREEKEKEEQKLKQLKEERLRAKQLENQKLHQDKGSSRAHGGTPKTSRKQDHQHKPTAKPLGSPGPTVHASLGELFTRQRSQSEGSDSAPPSPPPSVWKVPEYVEPTWNPGKLAEKAEKKRKDETKLNNDVVCERTKVTPPFNQLHNPVHTPHNPSFYKNQYMNQEKGISQLDQVPQPTEPSGFQAVKVLDRPAQQKPDNRQNLQANTAGYSSFSGLPNLLSQLQESGSPGFEGKSYSLFGRDEENVSVFRSPLTGH